MNNVTRDKSALAGKALKNALPEYTEDEFLAILKDICTAQGTEAYQDDLLENFIEVTGHPEGSDLIYYPAADSTPFGHSAHADPDTCSTLIRTGSRSAATQGWHC